MQGQKDFLKKLNYVQQTIDCRLDDIFPSETSTLDQAMRYAVMGGKRLRGFFVFASAELFGLMEQQILPCACAIECLHAYSLVHDDLPSMDNDDLRRGRLSVHCKWDEAMAILVGDALQARAFELLATMALPAETRVILLSRLARFVGANGMVLGQMQDIEAQRLDAPPHLHDIEIMQANKTGKLIQYAATVGAVIAKRSLVPLSTYAKAIGLAYQIKDDILDIIGDVAITGKRTHKDSIAGKATFVSLLGLEGAQIRAEKLAHTAINSLSDYGAEANNLREAAYFIIYRNA